jgi:hypothetical protein
LSSVTAKSQLAVAEDFMIVMGAAGFVTGHAPQAAVDGLPLEATAGSLRFRDDVPSREVSRAGALLEAGYGVENGGSAARPGVNELLSRCRRYLRWWLCR